MKNISSLNTESIVFVVEQDEVRRLLGMLLAAVGLDARIYPSCEEFLARHDSCQAQYLVLDISFPGMEGVIIRQRKTLDADLFEKKPAEFQLIPVKNRQFCESSPLTKRP
jgi:hypothetical protein